MIFLRLAQDPFYMVVRDRGGGGVVRMSDGIDGPMYATCFFSSSTLPVLDRGVCGARL